MAAKPQVYSRFIGGIADFTREGIQDSFAFARSIDVRSDPQNLTVLPRTIKESSNYITDLVKWMETVTTNSTTYMYGNTGNLYSRDVNAVYSFLRAVDTSHGNGLVYSQEDNFLYYARDKTIGRYGPIGTASATYYNDFLGSVGGVPQNTYSAVFDALSNQYASVADGAFLDFNGSPFSIDMQIKPKTFPDGSDPENNTMTLAGKWDNISGSKSYLFDIKTIAGFFGDGRDGPLVINSDQTETVIDSAFIGTSGSSSGTATNAGFVAGQTVLIHQTQGVGAGNRMRNTIQSYTAGTIVFDTPLNATYVTGAQVRVLKQYTTVAINSGVTWSAKPWDGTVGGILMFLYNDTFVNDGTITGTGCGFRGGTGLYINASSASGQGGENIDGPGISTYLATKNGGGGGNVTANMSSTPGGGGGGGTAGSNGSTGFGTFNVGRGGATAGSADLTSFSLGGGGGGGVATDVITRSVGNGGNGGAFISINGPDFTNTGTIVSAGTAGDSVSEKAAAGAGGSGGSIEIYTQTGALGTNLMTAPGGLGGSAESGVTGGNGGVGRIHISYFDSYTGTTTPTIDANQDGTLVTNESQALRLSISDDGSNSEVLTQVAQLQLDTWQQVGVTWDNATSTAVFYLNAVPIGTRISTLTDVDSNSAIFRIASSKDSFGDASNFFDGGMDEVRVFNKVRTAADMRYGLIMQIVADTAGIKAYWRLNNDWTDTSSSNYGLTPTNSPTFTSIVPFSSPETALRFDLDQQQASFSDFNEKYDVPPAIVESTTEEIPFTPGKDPQKSMMLNLTDLGGGDVTLTIHDVYNNVVAAVTVAAANLNTGDFEFVFDPPWRPLTNFTNEYHAHITSPTSGTRVKTGNNTQFNTALWYTFYQFLVEDTAWHPMTRFLNYWVIGNERYLGKFEAPLYEANKLVFESGERVRSLAKWNEYLAIGTFRGQNIYDFDKGRIYFWDGFSPTFNFSVEIEEGGINAMIGTRGKLYIWAGYKNQLLVYQGGNEAVKLHDMPNLEPTDYTEIYPQGVTVWQSVLRYAVGGGSNSTTLQKGVYTYGSTNKRYPEILTYDYPISTGNYVGTTLNIGSIAVVNRKLLIGWQDAQGFGVDNVDNGNPPYASSEIRFLIYDAEALWKQKRSVELVTYTTALKTGENILSSYSLDGSDVFVPNIDTPAVGDTIIRQIITNGDYYEMQVKLNITSDTTAPTIKCVVLVDDLNETENRF